MKFSNIKGAVANAKQHKDHNDRLTKSIAVLNACRQGNQDHIAEGSTQNTTVLLTAFLGVPAYFGFLSHFSSTTNLVSSAPIDIAVRMIGGIVIGSIAYLLARYRYPFLR